MHPLRTFSRSPWRVLALLLLAGTVLRVLYLHERMAQPDFRHPANDAQFHVYWARALVSGDWTPPPGFPDPGISSAPYFRPPGYPYALAGIIRVFGPGFIPPIALQGLLGLVNIALSFFLGRRWFGDAVGIVWAALMACHWSFIYFEGELLEPALAATLLLSLFAMVLRVGAAPSWHTGAVTGLLLGVLALVRPNLLLLAPGLVLWGLVQARRVMGSRRAWLGAAAAFALALALPLGASAVRNFRAAGEVVLVSANGGINLYIGNNPRANGLFNEPPELAPFGSVYDLPALKAKWEERLGRPLTYAGWSRELTRRAWGWVADQPLVAARVWGRKALLFWGPAIIGNNKADHYEKRHSRVLSNLPAAWGLLMGLACMGAWLTRRRAGDAPQPLHEARALALVVIACAFASYWPFFAAERYRVAWMPFVLLFAATGVVHLARLMRGGITRRGGMVLAACAILVVLFSRNWAGYRPAEADWHYFRGVAWREARAWEQAVQSFEQAWRLRPHHERTTRFLGECLYNLGLSLARAQRVESAAVHFGRAASLQPRADFIAAHALALVMTGRGAEGEAAYRKALALDGTQRDALNGLAWHLATQPGLEPERRLEAVDLARRACQLSESRRAEFLDTLAAAHAAAGQFDEARRAGREALALARAQGPAGLATDIQRRLALYEQDLAFIDAIPD